ncbi:MAG: hypothetical protein WC414_00170 [Patescibacteria group bacterium]
MNLKQYLSIMFFSTILSWIAWGFVIVNIDPFETSWLGFLLFFLSLAAGLIGLVSILIFLLYKFFASDELPLFRYVSASLKQSLIISFFLLTFLFLQMKSLLTWFNGIILLVIFILVISFTISISINKKNHNQNLEE